MQQISLSNIQANKIKNLLRGILSASNEVVSSEIFDRLYFLSDEDDLRHSIDLLSKAQRDRKISLSLPFPPQPPSVIYLETRDDLASPAFFKAQERRLSRYKKELLSHLNLIGRFNRAVEENDVQDLTNSLEEIRSRFGFCIHITRKVLSLSSRFEHDKKIISAIRPYYEGVTARRYLIHRAMDDTFDLSQAFIPTRRNFLRIADTARIGLTAQCLIRHHFSPIPLSDEEWVRRARAHASYSMPDLVMFILESRLLNDPSSSIGALAYSFQLPSELQDACSITQTQDVLAALDGATDRQPMTAEETHRYASAWLCDKIIAPFFIPIEKYAGPRFDGTFGIHRPFITTKPFSDAILAEEDKDDNARLLEANPVADVLGTNGPGLKTDDLQRTLFLVRLIETGRSFDDYNGLKLLSLLNNTSDVARLLSQLELDGAFPPKPSDRLYEALRTSLKFDSVRRISTEYKMRNSIEQLAIQEFGGNILDLLKFLYGRAPGVARFYMQLWTEQFLVQCYKLYDSAYKVNEARRSLLDWYGHETHDETLLERARSLGLENKLAQIRHEIDSQRLYVDLIRFKQWMLDELGSPLRRLTTSSIAQEVPAADIDLSDEVKLIESPEFALADIINVAFHEFCCNNAYGVDSYIGRRIRHGTFHGTLNKAAADQVDDILTQPWINKDQFEGNLLLWLSLFDDEVKRFAQERLQVRSAKKPKGLLFPYISTTAQLNTLRLAIGDIREHLVDRASIPETVDSISQTCWLLLEPNLIAIQRELERWRGDRLTLKKEHLYRGGDAYLDDQARTIVRRVNERVDETIQQIAAWFAAPKVTTPSATLQELFQVVRREVAGQIPGFDPVVTETESTGLRIVGHRYQYVYDALYILVHNAAQHGKKGGRLDLKVDQCVDDATNLVRVDVKVASELPDDSSHLRASIDEAMAAPMDDAMVTEGSTGIRKLRALAYPKNDIAFVEVNYPDNWVEFKFSLIMPTL